MQIAIPKERRAGEARVAASPDTVKKFVQMGFDVLVETGAGAGASIADQVYIDAGATIAPDAKTALAGDVVLKVQRPTDDEIASMKEGAVLISALAALTNKEMVEKLAARKVTAFAMELVPRITRAQSMDILSSQANLAGYKAVLDAVHEFKRAVPMMMTAAGTVAPARFLILGAGVAGLQAIATAKRMGGVVYAFDVRPAVKEQVESLGGKFVEVDPEATKDAETKGGYAKEMSEEYKQKQAAKIAETLAKTDIAICTALIPGRPAPVLITEDMVKGMRPGSVIVDLAVEAGGNCPLSEFDKVVEKHGVTLVGHGNVPARLAVDASSLYAKNLLNFISPLVNKETKDLAFNWDDEILKGCCVTRDGQIVHPALAG
ncbi:Re/Si-specific NAD(P)(+) transhydrogenase subunit alpha [Magnetospirillum moscoviense]|uniref:NAD(P) transhydrogenase subunit alpha part 1 n=1 Tax=Magnetospirillum moscoviense TaxID=1437059 RepID=A0A178MV89_9PROT|nr:Re/Si-specific NAD(P)(+) transhydrogenase subunit alpha [Magnetospirillum moscoviense]MBF0324994.1 Re/Si-specific NAD(P)(+) transhydrogenase subunit alpha [Alphaproteobacteria bacterium]OAN52785.1 NAD(P) transhydrogenase subunit alpha [Magnetospirillum moscoviense]